MKNIRNYGWVILTLLLSSCFKENHNISPAQPSILQFIARTPTLSILNAAVNRVQLDTAMSSGGPFTFFAPSDSAFQAAGLTMDSINRMDAQQLLGILEYQVVDGRISSADLPGFLKQQFTCLHPLYKPFITKSYYGIFINGIGVINGDNEVGDGVVQVTDRVAFPPSGGELQVLSQHPDLSFLTAFVRNVYAINLLCADPNPYSFYSGFNLYPLQAATTGNTLLAPTDSAWRAFGYPDSISLIDDSARLLYGYFDQNGNFQNPLFSSYLWNEFAFTCDLKGGLPIGGGSTGIGYRIAANAYLVSSIDGMSFTGNGIAPGNPVRITGPDIMATNGVIQKINQIFISHQ